MSLLGVKRTWADAMQMSAYDPKRTSSRAHDHPFKRVIRADTIGRSSEAALRRRDFICLVSGTAAWALVAHAQQSEGMRRIGVLMSVAADDPEGKNRFAAFDQGLQQLRWVDGRNV